MTNSIDKETIKKLLPHREPMLLVDRLTNIVPLKSATAIVNVKHGSFYFDGHFPPGSMGPKIKAVIRFLEGGGKRAIITNLENVLGAFNGNSGTHLIK